MFFESEKEMKGGILEVLLVGAEDVKVAHHILGTSNHYVTLECGNQTLISRTTAGKNKRAWWNEKFIFELSSSELQLTTHLKLSIKEKDKVVDDALVGETKVHLHGILREGTRRGSVEVKPAPYRIVFKDGRYEGEIKIGLKFTANVDVQQQANKTMPEIVERRQSSLYRRTSSHILPRIVCFGLTFQKIVWERLSFFTRK